MKISVFNRSNILIDFTTPKILIHKNDELEIECGPYITELDTGIYYSRYDYGYMLKVKILGFGLDIWWML